MDVQVRNAEVLERAGRALRGADRKYRRELFRGINRATKPLKAAVKAAIPDYMPRRGGYAALLQRDHSPRTQTKPGGRDPAVRIISRTRGTRRNVRALEEGRLAHPLFGNRSVWRVTDVKPGFFSEPMEQNADEVRDEVVDAIGRVHDQIRREI